MRSNEDEDVIEEFVFLFFGIAAVAVSVIAGKRHGGSAVYFVFTCFAALALALTFNPVYAAFAAFISPISALIIIFLVSAPNEEKNNREEWPPRHRC